MIYVEVEQDSLSRVQKALGSKADQAPIAVRNAANDTAAWARKQLLSEAQSRYTVKSGGFNKAAQIKKASLSNLTALIRVKGATLTLPRFRTTAPKTGVKAAVLSGESLRTLIYGGNKAFRAKNATGKLAATDKYGNMEDRKDAVKAYSSVSKLSLLKGDNDSVSTANMIMQRRGSARYPVKVLHGPSAPKMIEMVYKGGRITDEGLRVKIEAMYESKLNHEVERILQS